MPLHYSIGMLLLGLAVIRVVWRLFSRQPDWPVDMKPYEITIARVVHIAFYALLFAIPLSGWAVASVEDEPLRIFNRFEIPRLVLGGEDTLEEVHETLFNILVGLAVLHVIGAARHWLAARRLQSARR